MARMQRSCQTLYGTRVRKREKNPHSSSIPEATCIEKAFHDRDRDRDRDR